MIASLGVPATKELAGPQRELETGRDDNKFADDAIKLEDRRQAVIAAHVSAAKVRFLAAILTANPGVSAENQRRRILAGLAKFPLKTLEIRHGLDVLEVAARIWELRHVFGEHIDKIMLCDVAENGKEHKVALYFLKC